MVNQLREISRMSVLCLSACVMLTACFNKNISSSISVPESSESFEISSAQSGIPSTDLSQSLATSSESELEKETTIPEFQICNTETESGFIRPDGRRVVLDEKYDEIFPFAENRSVVMKDGKYGVIDDEGKAVTGLEFDYIYGTKDSNPPQFTDGQLEVGFVKSYTQRYYKEALNISSKSGIIDVNGNYIFEPIYDYISLDEQTGLYGVRDMYWKCGELTKDGEIVIPIIYDYISIFDKTNEARVCLGNKWGSINSKGEIVIPIEYAWIGEFNDDGLAVAKTVYTHFSKDDNGLGGDYAMHSSTYITSEQIINRKGEILYDLGALFFVDNSTYPLHENTILSLSDDNTAKVPVLDGVGKIKIDINGYWGQPEYAPYLGDYEEGKSMEDTPVPPIHYGQFKNEPIYKVIVWDDSIPYEIIDLS